MKRVLIVAVIVVVLLIAGGLLLISPIIYDVFHSAAQGRALQHRDDLPQIAAACVTLAHTTTNDSLLIRPFDLSVPSIIRSLSPHYISTRTNFVTLEFHGGFDHYGYQVQQSDADPKQWVISFYTEQGHKLLTTITND